MVPSLGVPLMDDDHAHLEALLQGVRASDDGELPALLSTVEAETRAHFAHEEDLMRLRGLAILACHSIQHQLFLGEFEIAHRAIESGDMTALRYFLAATLPELLSAHIDTVDRMTAFLLLSTDRPEPMRVPSHHETVL